MKKTFLATTAVVALLAGGGMTTVQAESVKKNNTAVTSRKSSQSTITSVSDQKDSQDADFWLPGDSIASLNANNQVKVNRPASAKANFMTYEKIS